MRIGIAVRLQGLPGWERLSATWESVRDQVLTAEEVGFDLAVVEDALSYPREDAPTLGMWGSMAVMGGLAEATERIDLGHSVVNAVYRAPAHLAKIAETLDEMSGGRYILGIGAGNTPDADYEAFGFPTDHRFSRFEEAIEIIHAMLKHGRAEFEGAFHRVHGAEMVLRGPRPQGPPIVIGAGGPRMIELTARFADGWNWWIMPRPTLDDIRPRIEQLEAACEEVGRDPASLQRSLDMYLPVAPLGGDESAPDPSAEQTAEAILAFGELGISEVRCYLPLEETHEEMVAAIGGMSEVVEIVQAG